ncbi:AraC family transcriptional regulator [Niallia alba]|uniref:AraC family transcriptional regulator n=1 Tax=Niallia alba TaxID=2729105 RepID=UPI002E247821|nr:AraC family transcriptional regulator [Niallia alba]
MTEKIIAAYRLMDKVETYEDFSYHSHDRYEIYYFHGGECKYLIGDRIYRLQEDDLIIMNGLTLHRAYPEPGIPYERSVIEFSSEWLRPILNNLNVPELLSPFNQLSNTLFHIKDKEKSAEVKALIKKMAEKLKSSKQENIVENRFQIGELTSMLMQLLFKVFELSKQQLENNSLAESDKNLHVKKMIEWIDSHFCDPITLDDIAHHLNISKYYMSRIFKDVTGYTIMQYIMSCRINRAKYLLEIHPDKSILEVSLASGFEDSSHFSRFFRKQMKLTPTEYRNSKAIRMKNTN